MGKFRVLAGKHVQKEQVGTDEEGKPVYAPRVYVKGEIVESKHDLKAMFDKHADPRMSKFERVVDTPEVRKVDREVRQMEEELKQARTELAALKSKEEKKENDRAADKPVVSTQVHKK